MSAIHFLVFLPLAAAVIAGLSNKAFGSTFPKIITTGALFVSGALSWMIFIGFINGAEPSVAPVFTWMKSGSLDVAWALRVIRSPR